MDARDAKSDTQAHEIAALWRMWRDTNTRIQDAEGRITALQGALLPLARTFWGRMRWLVLGD